VSRNQRDELVSVTARACNHTNLLSIPFRRPLVEMVAWVRDAPNLLSLAFRLNLVRPAA
jgi:hypothetical protein